MKYIDFAEDKKYDFILPIGATEQHGPFIPFGTDTYITDHIVDVLEKARPELVVIPTLEYSRSQEHRWFYGTIYLSEDTLERVMKDVCSSIKEQARKIFIISFHANDTVIDRFIARKEISWPEIINLKIIHDDDDVYTEKHILQWPFDEHAGNSEIANMMAIDERLAISPPKDYPKSVVEWPFDTDNLIEKCPDGIADNHPERNPTKEMWIKILDIYAKRTLKNLEEQI